MAAHAAALHALDLALTIKPAEVRLDEYPQLKQLTRNRPGAVMLAERDAPALYERHRHSSSG